MRTGLSKSIRQRQCSWGSRDGLLSWPRRVCFGVDGGHFPLCNATLSDCGEIITAEPY